MGLPFEESLVSHARLELDLEVMDVATKVFGAGGGIADRTRGLGFDYEAFGDVMGWICVFRGRTVPLHRV